MEGEGFVHAFGSCFVGLSIFNGDKFDEVGIISAAEPS